MSHFPRVHYDASIWQAARLQQQQPPSRSFASRWQDARMQPRPSAALQQLGGTTMGTTWSLRLYNPDFAPLAPVQALVQQTLDDVIAQMSNWQADSDISRFNHAAPGSWHTLPAQLAQVIDAALHWARLCGGAWDPTVGALVALWGFGPRANPQAPHSGEPPTQAAIAAALQTCGWRRLQWLPDQCRLRQPGGLQLDLSGIAKGFAVDWVAERLRQAGWQHSLLEIGGELRAIGVKPDGSAWRVAIAGLPPNAGSAHTDTQDTPETVALADGALASSGDHWHVFSHDGQRYSHTIDPRSGQPVAHALTSVSVWHAQCMHADALATVLTVLGPQAGWQFAVKHDIAAVLHTHPDAAHPRGLRRSTPAWDAHFAKK